MYKDEASLSRRRRRRERCAGLLVRGNSRANVAKSMWREHGLAVAAYHSHLTFEANSILHTGDKTEPEAAAGQEVFKLGYPVHLFYQHQKGS